MSELGPSSRSQARGVGPQTVVPATGASRVLTPPTGACGGVFYSPHGKGTTRLLDMSQEQCVHKPAAGRGLA